MNHKVIIDSSEELTSAKNVRSNLAAESQSRPEAAPANLIRRPAKNLDPFYEPTAGTGESSARNRSSALGLSRYVEPFLVYRAWWIGSLLLSALLGWAALMVWPRTYESMAKLQLLVGRESVGLDPSSTTTQTLLMQKTMEEDVNSALELLGSRDVAHRVVEELGAENILSGQMPSSPVGSETKNARQWVSDLTQAASRAVSQAIESVGLRDPISDQERAIVRLQDSVTVFAPKKSSTLIVSARSKTPELAQAIAQSYTKHFMDRYVDVATTLGSQAFFEQEAAQAEKELQALLNQRSSLLQKHKMASANSRFNILSTQLAAIETTIINSEAQINQTESELNDLTRSIQEANAEVVSAKQTQPDQAIVGMRNSLYTAELEEKRRAAVYTEGHPLLVQIRQQVLAAREALEKLEQDSESLSTTPNPIRLKLEEDQLKLRAKFVGLSSLLEMSKSQRDEKHQEINKLLEIELLIDQLDRQVEVAKKSLSNLREKEEQARVVDDLRQQRISSIGVAQPATFVEKAISPNKPLIAATILMLGLCTGVGLVGLREMTRKTIRNAEDVQRWLGYPVIAEIPLIRRIARRQFNTKDLRSRKLESLRSACRALQSEVVLSACNANVTGARGVTIGILGLEDDCGASLIASGLALVCSDNNNRHTTLVDLDLHKRTVSKVFGMNGQPGIIEFASGDASQADCVHRAPDQAISLVGSTSQAMTHTKGSDVKNVLRILEQLTDANDYVIFDFPPASRPDPILQLARDLDQLVIVVQSEVTDINVASRQLERIEKVHGNISGIVLARTRRYLPRWMERLIG